MWSGECGSRTCGSDCPAGQRYDPNTEMCGAPCDGPTSCDPGSVLLECGESSVEGLRECVPCGNHTYENNGECVPCANDDDSCPYTLKDYLVPCGIGEAEDVSECVTCQLITNFFANGCFDCPVRTWQHEPLDCEWCLYNSTVCNGDDFALVDCPGALLEDTSSCTNCTALGQFVSADNTSCVGGCPAGERPVPGTTDTCEPCTPCGADEYASVLCTIDEEHVCASCTGPTSCPAGSILLDCAESAEPGVRTCVPCGEGTYENNGECVACAATPETCTVVDEVLLDCGIGETSDVAVCTVCSASGMVVSLDGRSCVQAHTPVAACPAADVSVNPELGLDSAGFQTVASVQFAINQGLAVDASTWTRESGACRVRCDVVVLCGCAGDDDLRCVAYGYGVDAPQRERCDCVDAN